MIKGVVVDESVVGNVGVSIDDVAEGGINLEKFGEDDGNGTCSNNCYSN